MRKKLLSVLLVVAMVLSLAPVTALAAEELAGSGRAETYSASVWSGDSASGFAGGTGGESNPYRIETAEQLAFLEQSTNSGTTYENQYVSLESDIDLGGNDWTPIGKYKGDYLSNSFRGTFLGNNHTISNLYINNSAGSNQGLFGCTYKAVIQDLRLKNVSVKGAESVGGIAGHMYDSILSNCSVSGSVSGSTQVGGIVGNQLAGTITGSINEAVVSATGDYAGGISGNGYGASISDCFNTGNVSGNLIGGIVGDVRSVVNCGNIGSVRGGSTAGGIAGRLTNGSISYCWNGGALTGAQTGHIVSSATSSTISYCYYPTGGSYIYQEPIPGLANSYSELYTFDLEKMKTAEFAAKLNEKLDSRSNMIWSQDPETHNGFPYLDIHTVTGPYTITFNANGGTVDPATATTGNNGRLSSFPVPIRSGYTFIGWYTEQENGTRVNTAYQFTDNTTVYAHWGYTITFNANQGAFESGTETPTVTTDDKGQVSQEDLAEVPVPTRGGYIFDDWYTKEDGGELVSTYKFTKDTIVYAHWTKGFTIILDPNGGSLPTGSVTTVSTDKDGKLPASTELPTPTYTGYVFNGWFTEKENGVLVNDSYTFTRDTTIYAQWKEKETEAKEFTITFDANGGTVSPASAATTGGKLASLPTPTRSGYTFDGWYTAATGGTKVSTGYTFTGDTTLYAHWTQQSTPSNPGSEEEDTYTVQIVVYGRHGTATTSHASAAQGTRVTITVDPETDYIVDMIEAERDNGRLVSLSHSGRRYTFTMPASNVTVYIEFALRAVYSTWVPSQSQVSAQTSSSPTLTFTPVTWRPAVVLQDVPANSWAYPAAHWAYQNGYLDMAADGSFHLEDSVSNLQMWRIMAHWLGEAALDDGSISRWARQNGAARIGNASSAMTRHNMVEYLYQCCFLMGGDVSTSGNLIQYRDGQLITSASAKNAWTWAVDRGIISGTTDGYLNPNKTLTRGEFASILMRLCQSGVR